MVRSKAVNAAFDGPIDHLSEAWRSQDMNRFSRA